MKETIDVHLKNTLEFEKSGEVLTIELKAANVSLKQLGSIKIFLESMHETLSPIFGEQTY